MNDYTGYTARELEIVKQYAAALPATLQAPVAPLRAGKCQFEFHNVEISRGHFARLVIAFDYDDETRAPIYARAYLSGEILGGYFREWAEAELTATPAEPVYSTPATWAEAAEAIKAGRLYIADSEGRGPVIEIVSDAPAADAVIIIQTLGAGAYPLLCELKDLQIF